MTVPADTITTLPGAYVLVVHLPRPCTVTLARASVSLPPGRYAYCGSAYGPGGLRARIARHLRRTKTIRWHIDQLTRAGSVSDCHAMPGGNECDILKSLLAQPGAGVPVPGFGSSDCRTCPAHLVSLPAHVDLASLIG